MSWFLCRQSPRTFFLLILISRSSSLLVFVRLSDPLARGVPLKYFRFRPAACRLHPSNFGVVIHFAGRSPAASARPASSGSFSSRTSTCPVLSVVVALLFSASPMSFISALTIRSFYRCFFPATPVLTFANMSNYWRERERERGGGVERDRVR
jgi:hypothetical protein